MNKLTKSKVADLVSIVHGKGAISEMPKPFERDIFLFNTYVAGTTHIKNIQELEPTLNIGDKLDFLREPNNPHDKKAIVINNKDGAKIGYVPRDDNEIFSRLMDAGKLLFGRIANKEMEGNWLKIDIKIFLRE